VPLRVVEQTAHDPYRLGERLTISVIEPRQALIGRGAAVGMNLSQHRAALGGDADPNGPGSAESVVRATRPAYSSRRTCLVMFGREQ
jgi:hypothetical protein